MDYSNNVLTNFKNIFICVPKINEGLVGFERHEGE